MRASEGVIAMNISTCVMDNCTVEACFLGAGRVRGDALMRVRTGLVRLCGYGFSLLEHGCLYVHGSVFRNLTYGAFQTYGQFIRTVRLNLIDSTVYGVPWVTNFRIKRVFERGMKYPDWHARLSVKKAFRKAFKRAKKQGLKKGFLCQNQADGKETKPDNVSFEHQAQADVFRERKVSGEGLGKRACAVSDLMDGRATDGRIVSHQSKRGLVKRGTGALSKRRKEV